MKKTMKKILMIILASSLLVSLVACGNANIQIDIAKMGSDFSKLSIYGGKLTEVSKDRTIMKYMEGNLQAKKDVADAVSYVASDGKSADEIAIFECADGGNMANITNGINLYIRSQKEKFLSKQQEMNKLNSAIIINKGKYAIVSVSKDTKAAKKFIKEYLSK